MNFKILVPVLFLLFFSCGDSRYHSLDYSKEYFVVTNFSKFNLDSVILVVEDTSYLIVERYNESDTLYAPDIVFYKMNPFKIKTKAFLDNRIIVQDSFLFNCSWCSGMHNLLVYQDSISYVYHP